MVSCDPLLGGNQEKTTIYNNSCTCTAIMALVQGGEFDELPLLSASTQLGSQEVDVKCSYQAQGAFLKEECS